MDFFFHLRQKPKKIYFIFFCLFNGRMDLKFYPLTDFFLFFLIIFFPSKSDEKIFLFLLNFFWLIKIYSRGHCSLALIVVDRWSLSLLVVDRQRLPITSIVIVAIGRRSPVIAGHLHRHHRLPVISLSDNCRSIRG